MARGTTQTSDKKNNYHIISRAGFSYDFDLPWSMPLVNGLKYFLNDKDTSLQDLEPYPNNILVSNIRDSYFYNYFYNIESYKFNGDTLDAILTSESAEDGSCTYQCHEKGKNVYTTLSKPTTRTIFDPDFKTFRLPTFYSYSKLYVNGKYDAACLGRAPVGMWISNNPANSAVTGDKCLYSDNMIFAYAHDKPYTSSTSYTTYLSNDSSKVLFLFRESGKLILYSATAYSSDSSVTTSNGTKKIACYKISKEKELISANAPYIYTYVLSGGGRRRRKLFISWSQWLPEMLLQQHMAR